MTNFLADQPRVPGIENTVDVQQLFRLDGRVAVVTGGTRGIGRAIAEAFAAAGARVVVASRKADACAETEKYLEAAGYQALGVPCHLGSVDDIRRLVTSTAERFGTIDIIVNNAANPLTEPLGEFTEAGFTKSMEVNVKGPVFLIQEALPHLKASNHASVINVVSAGAWLFSSSVALYAAAKATMVSYTKTMAADFAPSGIRVNALAPGAVDTDMLRATGPEAAESMAKACLMARNAHPNEMVGPALFLASDASSYVTGSVVHADGGLVAR
ncbi:MAG TPA: glucose 1-dehydrogenase [Acidimicrobiales bacterium]|nr:glucose 1-dehydrogenase [Acidimicrobiales bacterium]